MTDLPAAPPVALAVLRDAASTGDLEDWGPLEEATGPPMATSGLTMWADESGSECGIWECTPGPSHWVLETNELVHVLAGSMTVTPDDPGAEPVRLGPGDSALFPLGWSGRWEIHERLRKLYVIF
ncbi:MAG TPA: cupin domain-containing protein [Acidimicrobiales bacterium]|nr:cupin domain-containing protein [Acidimicrobiales bacterium]